MMTENKIILDLCGGTGAWSDPYAKAGYDVRNITLPAYDVRTYEPPENVYGILAAPPCHHLAVSGARWWKTKGESALIEALAIVDACIRIIWRCDPVFWALENPIGRLKNWLGNPTMYFNPCDYGNPWTKKTCLWGNYNVPQKNPIKANAFLPHKILSKTVSQNQLNKLVEIKYLPQNHPYKRGVDRQILRAITPPGFAQAFFEANK